MENEQIKKHILDEFRRAGQILDINLAPYFDEHPIFFHETIKKSKYGQNFSYAGLLKGMNGFAEYVEIGTPDLYLNPMAGRIDPRYEACYVKENHLECLKEIFPQHKEEIEFIEQYIAKCNQ